MQHVPRMKSLFGYTLAFLFIFIFIALSSQVLGFEAAAQGACDGGDAERREKGGRRGIIRKNTGISSKVVGKIRRGSDEETVKKRDGEEEVQGEHAQRKTPNKTTETTIDD